MKTWGGAYSTQPISLNLRANGDSIKCTIKNPKVYKYNAGGHDRCSFLTPTKYKQVCAAWRNRSKPLWNTSWNIHEKRRERCTRFFVRASCLKRNLYLSSSKHHNVVQASKGGNSEWNGQKAEDRMKPSAPLMHICTSSIHLLLWWENVTKNDVGIRRGNTATGINVWYIACFFPTRSSEFPPGATICFTECMHEILWDETPHERINNRLRTIH